MKKTIFFIFSFITILYSCNTTKKTSYKKTNSSYNFSNYSLHPVFKIFHPTRSKTQVYYKIFTDELRYVRINSKNAPLKASLKIIYKVYNEFNTIKTDTLNINVNYVKKQTSIIGSIELFDLPSPSKINIQITDIHNHRSSETVHNIIKSDPNNEQMFLTQNVKNNKIKFQNYLTENENINISHHNTSLKNYFVEFYSYESGLPLPPYSTIEPELKKIKPDSVFKVNINSFKAEFSANKRGVYIIKIDSLQKKGLVKSYFNKHYPLLKSSEQLYKSLQYLLNSEEYTRIDTSKNKKLEVDIFWLKATRNNKSKARQLIKIWYTRASYANYFFTETCEGWKTDRGMIYMMFGMPKLVEKKENKEIWTYHDRKAQATYTFEFIQTKDIFGLEVYKLKRNSSYRRFWFDSFDDWRAGKIYELGN